MPIPKKSVSRWRQAAPPGITTDIGHENQHRAGTDLTFSLPKSWSVLALVGGEIHAPQHLVVTEGLFDAPDFNHTFHLLTASFSFSTDTLISARLSLCEP